LQKFSCCPFGTALYWLNGFCGVEFGVENSPAVLEEQLYTGVIDFVGWSLVLNFTEAHAGLINYVKKSCATEMFI